MRIDERTLDLSPGEGARGFALRLLSDAREAAGRLEADADDEALHDFRVALRRLRTALRALRPWLKDRVPRRHEKRLRKIARSTNEARDAEVQLAWLDSQRAALASGPRRAGFDRLVERLEERGRSGPDPARVADRFRRAAAKLRRQLGARPSGSPAQRAGAPSLRGVLATLARDQVAALRERMGAIRGPSDREAIHLARIEGKRLRYLLEPLRSSRRAGAARTIAALKRLHDVLGDLHDAHVLADELREALVDVAAERALQVHALLFAEVAGAGASHDLRANPRAGLLAIARLVRARRDTLHAEVERAWRAGGMDALSTEVRAVAASLEAGTATISDARIRAGRAVVEGRAVVLRAPQAMHTAGGPGDGEKKRPRGAAAGRKRAHGKRARR